jgi:hypothetical protein
MIIEIEGEKKVYEVFLVDNGTLDTVLTVNGFKVTYDSEFASPYRDERGALTAGGFHELALDAIEAYEEDLEINPA